MEQLILHLIGDYIAQTDWMAKNKVKSWWAAYVHAFVYSLPFALVFKPSITAFVVIFFSHYFIDHYRLARYVIFAKNWTMDQSLKWEECKETGYHKDVPAHISFWLMIIADNTLHLVFNYSALRWL